MKSATYEEAAAAKEVLAAALAGLPELRGIGIAVLDGGFGVKVNLSRQPADVIVPIDVDGVPVVLAIVGTIKPQS
jgi:hypothetical protein